MKCRRNLLGEGERTSCGWRGDKANQAKVMWEWECGSGGDYRALSNRTASQWPHKALPEKPAIPTGSGSDYRELSNRTASQWPYKALPEKPTIPTGSGSDYRALSNRTASQWLHKALPENPVQKTKVGEARVDTYLIPYQMAQ